MDDANLLGFTHGKPPRAATEGFLQGIAEMLVHQGYEGAGAANIDLPQLAGIVPNIMYDHPAGPIYDSDGKVNINIALTTALEMMHRVYSPDTHSFHTAIITDRSFTQPGENYQFCRASSMFLYAIKDGKENPSQLLSPFYSTLFLSAPSIATDDETLLRDRARILGMHEQLHAFEEGHCDAELCLMTSGEKDGLLGGRVSNDELDAKVAYLREHHKPYRCTDHDKEYNLSTHPLWKRD